MTTRTAVSRFPSMAERRPGYAARTQPRRHRGLLHRGAAAATLLLAVACSPAMAATFCVGTGNELASALESAAYNQQNDEIRIRMGTLTRSGASGSVPRWEYDIGAGVGDNGFSLSVSGGWTSCSNQVADPQLTVLDAQYQGTALEFQLYRSSSSLRLSNLTITRGQLDGSLGYQSAANLGIRAPYSSANILVDRVIVIAGKSVVSGSVAGIRLAGSSDGEGGIPLFTLRNSVVAYNTGITGVGVDVNAVDSMASLTNNSIFANTASLNVNCRCAGLDLSSQTAYVSNNVVVNNSEGLFAADVRNQLGNSYLRNNHIGSLNAVIPPVFNLGATTGAPDWTINGIYPTPNASSPLRDSGYNTPVGGLGTADLAGNTRKVNGTVDRGAIEAGAVTQDLIFADNFE